MARREELEIAIGPDGRVEVRVEGIPGPGCLQYVEVFQRLLGPVQEQHPTPEMYEAETQVGTHQSLHGRLPSDPGGQ